MRIGGVVLMENENRQPVEQESPNGNLNVDESTLRVLTVEKPLKNKILLRAS